MNFAVQAIHEIATQLGKTVEKKEWNFNKDCNDSSWVTPKLNSMPFYYNNSLICTCSYPDGRSYPDGQCHVVQLYVNFLFRLYNPSLILIDSMN